MADTLPCVTWHLEFACPFRQGDAVKRMSPAWEATGILREIDAAEERGDRFGDVCVTSTVYFKGDQGPHGGFRVSAAVAPVGDEARARDVCGKCPANALHPKLAGCCGSLGVHPEDEKLNKAIKAAIAREKLADAFGRAFLVTTPLWYGFWVHSPLSREQMEMLPKVLPTTAGEEAEVMQFRRACELALRNGLRMHVNLAPPGHTDFGFITTFAHCPRCKKGQEARWLKHPQKPANCSACGTTYVPAETQADMKEPDEADSLEKMLTPDEFRSLRQEWEARQATRTPSPAEEILKGIASGEGMTSDTVLARLWRRWRG